MVTTDVLFETILNTNMEMTKMKRVPSLFHPFRGKF